MPEFVEEEDGEEGEVDMGQPTEYGSFFFLCFLLIYSWYFSCHGFHFHSCPFPGYFATGDEDGDDQDDTQVQDTQEDGAYEEEEYEDDHYDEVELEDGDEDW